MPGILVLDQPSQVYFPSDERYRNTDGSIEHTRTSGVDLSTVSKMFQLLFHTVNELDHEMQLIMLEHANLDLPEYQDALVEEPWDWEQRALVPPSWSLEEKRSV